MADTIILKLKAVADMSDVLTNTRSIEQALSKLKLPSDLKKSFTDTFGALEKEVAKYQQVMEKGFSTKADVTALKKSGDEIVRLVRNIETEFNKIDPKIFKDLLPPEIASRLSQAQQAVENMTAALANTQGKTEGFKSTFIATLDMARDKAKEAGQGVENLGRTLGQIKGSTLNSIFKNIELGNLDKANEGLVKLRQRLTEAFNGQLPQELDTQLANLGAHIKTLQTDTKNVSNAFEELEVANKDSFDAIAKALGVSSEELHRFVEQTKQASKGGQDMANSQRQFNNELESMKGKIQYFFGLNNAINLFKRGIREAFNTIKELDKVMTETAVVTDFSVGDMWDQLPEYTQRANELGISTKAAYEAATLFYQQGLKTNEVVALSNETLKMARIAGLDAAVATDRMTNALRGFNMELNEMSAQRVNDVYSQLAAKSASNVDEISTAMTKVASLAHSAGMEFETTSAFLAQIIETTRESAETAGTALKTVIARFSEVKKLVNEGQLSGKDSEGEGIDVNKVQAALRTAGVDMSKFFLGEEGLDQVFLELASKWDSLTTVQQRFIATQAAGSRQQSRFIAMMQDYARTQELVQLAYEANGASAEQFAKTQKSLESKLARLKNAWDEFLMGLTNSDLVKGAVDLLTNLLNGINKLTKGFDKGSSSVLKWAAAIGTIVGGKALLGSQLGTAVLGDVGKLFGLKGETSGAPGLLQVIANFGKQWKESSAVASEAIHVVNKEAGELTNVIVKTSGTAQTAIAADAGALTGLGTALGIIAGAVAAVGAAYLYWLNTTEAGELKQLETWSKSVHKTLDELKTTVADQQRVLEEYNQQTKKLNDTVVNSPERDAAIKERNQYILDLIEQDKTYAQYLKTTFDVNGQMILSFDEAGLTNAITAGIDASRIQEYVAGMSDAAVSNQQYKIAINKANAVQNTGYTEMLTRSQAQEKYGKTNNVDANFMAAQGYSQYFEEGIEYFVRTVALPLTKEQEAEQARYLALAEGFKAARDAEATQALGGLVKDGTNGDIANGFISSVVDQIPWDKIGIEFEDSVKVLASQARDNLESEYLDRFTNVSSADLAGLSNESLARSIQWYDKLNEVLPGVIDKFDLIGEIDPNSDTGKGLAFLGGAYDSSVDWLHSDFSSTWNSTGGEVTINGDTIDFDGIRELTGQSYEEIGKGFEDEYKRIVQQQTKAQDKLIKALSGTGTAFDLTNREDEWLQHLSAGMAASYTDFIENVKAAGLLSQQDQQDLFTGLPKIKDESMKSIMQFNENFSLDSPLAAFGQLQAAMDSTAAKGSVVFTNYLQGVAEANASTLSLTSMFDEVVKADSFEDVAEALAKISKKEKDITAADIKEVAASSAELNTLLSYGIDGMGKLQINAAGVARAMNAWQQGKITLEQITGGVLETLSGLKTIDDEIATIEDHIANFKPGPDFGEGSDFIVKWADEAKKYIENYEFGNPILEGIYDQLFGSGAYEKIMAEASGDLEKTYQLLTENLNQLSQWAANNSEQFMHEAATNMSADWQKLGVTYEESVGYIWDVGTRTTQELIADIMDVTKGSYDSAVMILEGFLAQSYTTKKELEENDIVSGILQDLESGTLRTVEDFETLGATIGKTFDELQEIAKEHGIDLKIDFVDKDGNLLSGNELTQALDKVLQVDSSSIKPGQFYEYAQQYLEKFADAFDAKSNSINLRGLLNDLVAEGMTLEQAQEAAMHIIDVIQKALDEEQPGKELKLRPNFVFAESEANADEIIRNLQEEFETVNSVEIHANTDPLVEDIQQAITDLKTSTGGLNIDEALAAGPLDKFQRSLVEAADNAAEQAKIDEIFKQKTSTAVQTGITQARIDQVLAEGKLSQFTSAVTSSIEAGAKGVSPEAVAAAVTAAQARITALIKQAVQQGINDGAASANPTVNVKTQTTAVQETKAAGGIMAGAAWALTGEEGAEIVWNKEAGYSYITGKDGPQFQYLQPGDRIFNAQETARILRSSNKTRAMMESYGTGGYRPKTPTPGGGSSGGADTIVAEEPVTVETSEPVNVDTSSSSSGSDYVKQSTWRNDIDWLYNLVEDISELERQQSLISEKHDLYLKSIDKNGRDLLTLTEQELSNLLTQYDNQQTMYVRRLQEMNELMTQYSQYSSYVRWNQQDQTLEIDWDRIEAIRNKETYDEIKDIISRAEAIQSKIDDAESAMSSLTASIQEIKTRYLQAYLDFQSRVMSAVVAQYQHEIDTLSELNDTLNDSNAAILESIRNEIDMQRQIRDNTDTEKAIADMEARLAYLMRDTSGANQSEILSLQKQLEDEREKYSDTLMDQAVGRLEDQNEKAREQREQQIELLEQQLEFWQETGALWEEVADLMSNGFSADGALIGGSKLEQVLRDAEGWQAMSMAQRESWANELIMSTNQVGAYLLQISEGLDSLSAGIWASLPAHSYTSTKSEGGYATGGLNTRTGYAMLHGTANEPEYVLNARQTDAFMRLVDVLPSIIGGSGGSTTNYGGTMNLYFNLQVDQIANDYDVDRIADRVKDIIYDSGAYRNINVLKYAR